MERGIVLTSPLHLHVNDGEGPTQEDDGEFDEPNTGFDGNGRMVSNKKRLRQGGSGKGGKKAAKSKKDAKDESQDF